MEVQNSSTRSSEIRILLINPNSTEPMTAACLEMIQPTLPPDVIVGGFTCPSSAGGPTAIESVYDGVFSAVATIRSLTPFLAEHDPYDAFLVACFSPHPLVTMLREEFTQPVIGIMEASLLYASTLGSRIGVLATSARSKFHAEDAANLYVPASRTLIAEHAGLGVLDLEHKPAEEVESIMFAAASRLVSRDADVVVLGCAGMTKLRSALERRWRDVHFVDGVLAGVHHLIGAARTGARTAKNGAWRSSAEERTTRGQAHM